MHDPVELEQAPTSKSVDSGHNDIDPEFSPDEQRRIVRRIDKRLIVTCGLMYCISLMDRTNLSNAAIAGMVVELNLIGFRYSTIALVFFATYTLCQPPATVMCRKIGPRPFLASITLAWGIVMIGFGFPETWGPMIPLRLILGVLEAGFFPGCVYLISTWYTRYELQKRYSIFYLIGCLASACSGILAYGLMQMDGLADYSGWRWIFIMEGILTCVVGIIGYLFLVDFPDRAAKTSWAFLNERECQFIIRRIAKDRSDAELEPFNLKKWAASGLDLKIWGFAGILMFATSWAGDRWHMRGPVLVFNCLVCFVGLPLMGFVQSSGVRYFGVFLTTAGVNANIPAAMAYQANNIRGQWKRAFASATLVGFGGIGGIAGSTVFRGQDSPHYTLGIGFCIACNILIMLIVVVNTIVFRRQNRRADNGEVV